MTRMTVNWIQPQFGAWFKLEGTTFSRVVITGVYIIWHAAAPGQPGRYVKVGQGKQGNVGARLTAHQTDGAILAYRQFGELYVTWASVSTDQVDGVERFLGDHLKPLIGDRYPDVTPTPVNLPR